MTSLGESSRMVSQADRQENIPPRALLIIREYGNETNDTKISRRKWVEGRCETVMGNNGGDWKSIAVSARRLFAKDASMKHVLPSPYEIFEILMDVSHEQRTPMLKLRIGAARNTWSYATLNIMTHAIEGILGKGYVEDATISMKKNGAIANPIPKYGYLGGSRLTH